MGDYEGRTGLSPPAAYPSKPWGTIIFEGSRAPEHHTVYKETTHIPLGPWPYRLTGKGYGQPQRNDEPPPQLTPTSTHSNHMIV
jgi:hypothetical protein